MASFSIDRLCYSLRPDRPQTVTNELKNPKDIHVGINFCLTGVRYRTIIKKLEVRNQTVEVDKMKLKQEKALKEYNYLWRKIEKLWHEIAWKAGVSDSTYEIFSTILELGEGCHQKDICNRNSISKQTIHSAIKKLEREGLIEVRKEHGKDKRVYLTLQGKDLVKEKILPAAEAENQVFAEMTEEESRELVRLTEKYLIQLQAKIEQL